MKRFIYILTTVLLIILISSFTITCKDIMWSTLEINTITDLKNIFSNTSIISIFNLILNKNDYIRILTITILILSMFTLLKNIINKNNNSLFFLGLFLFLLIDKEIFASVISNTSGFISYFISSLCLLILLNIFLKSKSIPNILLLLSGFIITSIEPSYSFTAFIIILINNFISIHKHQLDKTKKSLLIGAIIGIIICTINYQITYTGFSYNLLHEFIPIIIGSNLLISIILMIISSYIIFKIYQKNKRFQLIIYFLGLLLFILAQISIDHDIIIYIIFIIYNYCLYKILKCFTNNIQFKTKIDYIFLFKLIFIIIISLFGNITLATTFILNILDILLILLLYNYIFPKDFLMYTWFIATIVFLLSYIYIYENVKIKNDEMNIYVKNKLECSTEHFEVPNKYKSEYLINQLPENKDELLIYIDYYNINVYDLKERKKIEFKP